MKILKSLRKVFLSVMAVFLFVGFASCAHATTVSVALDNYAISIGQTAQITITFSDVPIMFRAEDVTAENGVISNVQATANPKVFTATFTPNTDVIASTNVISVASNPITPVRYADVSLSTPSSIAFDGHYFWVANAGSNSVSKFDPATPETMINYPGTGANPREIIFDGTNLWTANTADGSITKIDISSGTPVFTTYNVLASVSSIVFDGRYIWVAGDSSYVSKVDTHDPTIVEHFLVGPSGSHAAGIVYDGRHIWIADNDPANNVTEFNPSDPEGTAVSYSGVGATAQGITYDGHNIWITSLGSNILSKVDDSGTATNGTITPYDVGLNTKAIVCDGTGLWASTGNPSIDRLDLLGVGVNFSTDAALAADAIFYQAGYIWIVNSIDNSIAKIQLTSVSHSPNYIINTTGTAVITRGTLAPDVSSAYLEWTTDISTSGQVEYGTTTSYGQMTSLDTTSSTGHSATMTPLLACTTYHYRIHASLAVSDDDTFVTGGCHRGGGGGGGGGGGSGGGGGIITTTCVPITSNFVVSINPLYGDQTFAMGSGRQKVASFKLTNNSCEPLYIRPMLIGLNSSSDNWLPNMELYTNDVFNGGTQFFNPGIQGWMIDTTIPVGSSAIVDIFADVNSDVSVGTYQMNLVPTALGATTNTSYVPAVSSIGQLITISIAPLAPLRLVTVDSVVAVPVVTNVTATFVTQTSAVLNATVLAGTSASRGFNFGKDTTYGKITVPENGTTTNDIYKTSVNQLECGTTYHVRGVAKNKIGIGYSADSTFTTLGCILPTTNTNQPTKLTVGPVNTSGSAVVTAIKLMNPISLGSRNNDVRVLQNYLRQTGYLNAVATGYFGKMTFMAVKNLQLANGLDSVGRVGPKTLQLINTGWISK